VRPELVEIAAKGQPQSRWGQPFDVEGTDALRLQGDIAAQVVDAMEVAVAGTDRARLVQVATRDPAAYDAYLRGQAARNWGSDNGMPATRRAIPFFEEAVRRDSTLVDAWAALAYARARLYINEREKSPALAAAAREAAERTLALDPTGARGLTARAGYRRLVAFDYTGARADLDAAVRADPNDAQARASLGFLLAQQLGRPAEALPHLERAAVLDPRAVAVHLVRAQALMSLGRFAEARAAADRAVALGPDLTEPAVARLLVDLSAGDTAAARATVARLAEASRNGTLLLALAGDAGDLMDAATAARALATPAGADDGDRGEWASRIAYARFVRGDRAGARAWGDTAARYLAPAAARPEAGYRVLVDLAWAEALAGRGTAVASASRALARMRAERRDRGSLYAGSLYGLASVAAVAGATDSALAWLAEARALPSMYTPAMFRQDPSLAALRGDPRFEALLARPQVRVAPDAPAAR